MSAEWSSLPLDRVIHLIGPSTQAFELATEPLPAGAPAILTYYPRPQTNLRGVIEALLTHLEADALRLLPVWLPGSQRIPDASGAGVAAIRSLAMRLAMHSVHFGPFIADLAEQALTGRGRRVANYPPEVRAPALAKIVATSYGRDRVALLVDVPAQLSPAAQSALSGACEWLVAKGGFGIWLSGPSLASVDRIEVIRWDVPAHVREILRTAAGPQEPLPRDRLVYPPIAGRPRHNSAAERLLEQALLGQAWSRGRSWNQPYSRRPQYVVDLMWSDERCVVEIDGPDHRGSLKFARDRHRDVHLQLDGYAVLRFTNDRIIGELDQVLAEIKQYLQQQRQGA
jgi:very-short-patch-repair endonuclease